MFVSLTVQDLAKAVLVLGSASLSMAREDPIGFAHKVGERFRQAGMSRLGKALLSLDTQSESAEGIRARLATGELTTLPNDAEPGLSRSDRRLIRRARERYELLVRDFPTGGDANASRSSGGEVTAQLRVGFLLNNSLPFTQSGYTLRSHMILQALKKRGVSATAVTRLAYPLLVGKVSLCDTTRIDGVEYHHLIPWVYPNTLPQRTDSSVTLMEHVLAPFNPSVIHTTTDYNNALVASRVAARLGIPWVYEVRGELEKTWLSRQPEDKKQLAANSEFYTLARAQETAAMQAADAVVALSEVSKAKLVERGVAPNKIWVIPNAVDSVILAAQIDKSKLRKELEIDDRPTVGIVTSVVSYEGIDFLLRAATLSGEYNVLIVGDGVETPRLKALADELGITDRVKFVGRQPADVIWKWYGCLDVFALPRKDEEVCRTVTPIKALSAQALGIPVVASDLPAIREITGGLAQYCRPEDPRELDEAIRRALAEPRNIDDGRKWAQEHSWESNAARYEEMYRQIKAR